MNTRVLAVLAAAATLAFAAPSAAHARPADGRAMGQGIRTVVFDQTPLIDAIGFVRDVSGVTIVVEWPVLEAAGIDQDYPISFESGPISVRRTLRLILQQAGTFEPLTFYVEDGVLTVTTLTAADARTVVRVYPVQDLIVDVPDFIVNGFNGGGGAGGGGGGGGGQGGTGGGQGGGGQGGTGGGQGGTGGGQGGGGGVTIIENTPSAERAQQLIDLITATIRPDVWDVNGGTASIRFFGGNLVVNAPRDVHQQLAGPLARARFDATRRAR